MRRSFFRVLMAAVCVLMLCAVLPVPAHAATTGNGTASSPYVPTTWADLHDVLWDKTSTSKSSPTYIKVLATLTASSGSPQLELPSGRYASLNLIGTINANNVSAVGSVLTVHYNSELTLTGTGTIKGGNAVQGGGVFIEGGTFTMKGCTISGNSANRGGGVYVSITAYDGTRNYPSRFVMEGGKITNNTAPQGGGVYLAYCECELNGSPEIYDNYTNNTSSKSPSNVYILKDESKISVNNANWSNSIGITCATGDRNPAFTKNWNAKNNDPAGSPQKYFKSDDPALDVIPSGRELKLGVQYFLVKFVDSDNPTGSPRYTQSVKKGDPATKPSPDPVRQGYQFGDWYKEQACSTAWNFNTQITQDTTIYGKWTAYTYKIHYEANGGGGMMSDQTLAAGDNLTVNGFSYQYNSTIDYYFLGWSRDSSAATASYNDRARCDTILQAGDTSGSTITLYAIWHGPCTVRFDLAGGTGSGTNYADDQIIAYRAQATAPDPEPEKTGHTFNGWYFGGRKWEFTTPVTSDMTLTASWTAGSHTVNFYDDIDPATPQQTIQANYGSLISAPTLNSSPGYHIDEWYTDADYMTQWNFSSDRITDDQDLFGQWEPNTYLVQFDPNAAAGGDGMMSDQSFTYGLEQQLSGNTFTNTADLLFAGWGEDAAATAAKYTNEQPVKNLTAVNGNVVKLYALWGYSVSFDSNGGTVEGASISEQVVPSGGTAAEPDAVPSKVGYRFDGWEKDGVVYDFSTPVTENITLTAKWDPVYRLVDFDTNEGNPMFITTQRPLDGSCATKPVDPSREDFVFMGWQKADIFGDPDGETFDFGTPITEDTTLVAVWEPIPEPEPEPRYTPMPVYIPTPAPAPTPEPAKPALTIPISGDSSTVRAGASVSGKTVTVDNVNSDTLERVIGKGIRTGEVIIDAADVPATVETAELPAQSVRLIARASQESGNDVTGMNVRLTGATVSFDAAALDSIAGLGNSGELQLHVSDNAVLNTAQRSALSGLDTGKALRAYISAGDRQISDFGRGQVTVSVPFTLPTGRDAQNYTVYCVGKNGSLEALPTSYGNGSLRFSVGSGSDYVVVYDDPACPRNNLCPISRFNDASPTRWYHDGVHYALENELMEGYSTHVFAPQDTITRAEIVTILWRLAGQPTVSQALSFRDVPADSWYANAARWAVSAGVADGYSRNTFAPGDPITREQLAAMLYRYAGLTNSLGAQGAAPRFPDSGSVARWAAASMDWATATGIITGMAEKSRTPVIAPKDSASRAQAAEMLMRFCTMQQ